MSYPQYPTPLALQVLKDLRLVFLTPPLGPRMRTVSRPPAWPHSGYVDRRVGTTEFRAAGSKKLHPGICVSARPSTAFRDRPISPSQSDSSTVPADRVTAR